jgi:hypothetical protein
MSIVRVKRGQLCNFYTMYSIYIYILLVANVQTEYINQQTSSPTELEANVQTEYINQQTSSPTELEANNS